MDAVKLHAHQALRMTRQQALNALAENSTDPEVKRLVELMQAGPDITDEDAARLAGAVQRLSPCAKATRSAFRFR